MRIFVVEYITGGGLIGGPMSSRFLAEAETMLGALLDDLSVLPDVHLLVSRDPRLPPLDCSCDVFTPAVTDDIWQAWAHCINRCDAVWAIMPESDGLLQRISRMTLAQGRRLIGSHPAGVAIAASKSLTAKYLQRMNIDTVPTFDVAAKIPFRDSRWVLKPDDGAGGEGARAFASYSTMRRALQDRDRYTGYVAQPYVQGIAASLSMLCCDGTATLLSANLQQVHESGEGFELEGVLVNGIPNAHAHYSWLARSVARAIPGLWGYVGVDLVLTAGGPLILEVNPRLTVSYAGLHSALAVNPARLILRMLRKGFVLPPCTPVSCWSSRVALDVSRVA
ncbi:MAG TPA: ATP-grasp domain-containing protein [Gammaproteobacteria bacterium]|nr:ATP-grasp domain-containing protein [Gammaproteobacteria bacterium]